MRCFSGKNIELLTDIKAPTLRLWEQRYSFLKASKERYKQRLYTHNDLQKLLSISFLYHNGWRISKIASLSNEEIELEVQQTELHDKNYKTYVQKLLRAAMNFNEAIFFELLNSLARKIGFEKTIVDVCYPYLQKLNLLWEAGNVTPAQEHFSTYIIENRLISETEKFSDTQNDSPELVLYSSNSGQNELRLLYLNYLLRKYGWKVLYLGNNNKMADLKEAAQVPGIKYLYLHSSADFTGFTIDDYFEKLRKAFPDKMILASGAGTMQSQRNFTKLRLLTSDEEIIRFIRSRS